MKSWDKVKIKICDWGKDLVWKTWTISNIITEDECEECCISPKWIYYIISIPELKIQTLPINSNCIELI